MKLVVLICFIAAYIGAAVGVKCYVGVEGQMVYMDCGTASDKCIKTKENDVTAKVCYNQIDLSRFPMLHTTVGCHNYIALGVEVEICICVGDGCNGAGPDKTESFTLTSPTSYKPTTLFEAITSKISPKSTPADIGFGVHHVSTETLMVHKHKEKHWTTKSPTEIPTSGVSCYVGIGNSTFLQHCPASSNKCVKSRVNDVVAKVCYSQMAWSKFPAFDPRLGCQKFSADGTETEICICTSDKCNEGGFDGTISTTKFSKSVTTTPKPAKSGVTCETGVGSATIDMHCGPSTTRCVFTQINDVVAKLCYNQMMWSMYPMFHPTMGCQEARYNEVHAKICICSGDKCNSDELGLDQPSNHAALRYKTTSNGSGSMYTKSISILLMIVLAGCHLK